jgi:hypothetical protein
MSRAIFPLVRATFYWVHEKMNSFSEAIALWNH